MPIKTSRRKGFCKYCDNKEEIIAIHRIKKGTNKYKLVPYTVKCHHRK